MSEIQDVVADKPHDPNHPFEVDQFPVLRAAMHATLAQYDGRMFFHTVMGTRTELFDAYLAGFDNAKDRQEANCSCCRGFLRRYGNMVVVDDDGRVKSALWDENAPDMPNMYRESVRRMRELVESKAVRAGMYHNRGFSHYGWVERGGFNHFAFRPSDVHMRPELPRTAGSQISVENKRIMAEGLGSFDEAQITAALNGFRTDKVLCLRTDAIEIFEWALKTKQEVAAQRNHLKRNNLLFLRSATATPNLVRFAQIVEGKFIENMIAKGFDAAKAMYLDQTKGENYMRAKAAPSVGAVKRAEEIFKDLGLQRALERRSLRREEIPASETIWQAREIIARQAEEGSVFGHLKTKEQQPVGPEMGVGDLGTMTWIKFRNTYLADAKVIKARIGSLVHLHSVMTAVHDDAPPILRWDKEDRRNPVSMYGYVKALPPGHWNLEPGWHDVHCITPTPDNWYEKQDETLLIVLKNGRDCQKEVLALFPNNLRPELHEVRSVIEAFSNTGMKQGVEEGFPALTVHPGPMNLHLEVNTGAMAFRVVIDRFD